MKSRKISLIVLSSVAMLLAGCGGNSTTSTTPSSTKPSEATTSENVASSSVATSSVDSSSEEKKEEPAEEVSLRLKATSSSVEIGYTTTVKAIVDTNATEKGCTFTVSDESIATIEVADTNKQVTVTGVSVGKVTITATSIANTSVSKSVTIEVIPVKPSLQQAIRNINELNNYTIEIGTYDVDTDEINPDDVIKVIDSQTILRTSYDGDCILTDVDDATYRIYGEAIDQNGRAVYVGTRNGQFLTEDAKPVRGHLGLYTEDTFMGRNEEALAPDEVGQVFSFKAFNPNWFTDEKAEDNKYEVEGGELADNGVSSTDQNAAYAECVLWEMLNLETYTSAVNLLGQAYYTSLASEIDTEFKVLGQNTLQAVITLDDNTSYGLTISEIGTTEIDNDDVEDALDSLNSTKPTLVQAFDDIRTTVAQNNYVQANSMYPDHSTEFIFNTYFTPNYVFYDCNESFRANYNTLTTETWDDVPYGYAKKADGVYKFTLNEDDETITWESTPEVGTDASTDFTVYENYISNFTSITTDLIYSFGDEQESLWSSYSNTYHISESFDVALEFLEYYAPEDIPEDYERVQSGIGVYYKDGAVSKLCFTTGFTPYTESETSGSHTYGVDNFALTDFGNATENRVNDLLDL